MRRLAGFVAASALLLGALTGRLTERTPASRVASAAPAQDPLSYHLTGTWSNVPWTLTPGRYGEAVDISSAPDGTEYVLDRRHTAFHVLAPDATARAVFEVTGVVPPLTVQRLDVGTDGDLYILSNLMTRRGGWSQLDKVDPTGHNLASFSFSDTVYADVAVGPDGRIYLVRPQDSDVLGRRAVDVYDQAGQLLDSLSPPELDVPTHVDVAADGTVYILQDITVPAVPQPTPGPRPTPGPSGRTSPEQVVVPIPGVVILAPNHTYRETVPFEFGIDVAVGPAGVFVARYGEIYALRASAPLSSPVGQRWSGALSLDVPPDGRVLASVSNCYFQGVLGYDNPNRPTDPWLKGALDAPELEGPVYPIRVAAGDGVQVLEGSYEINNDRPLQTYNTQPYEHQSVQRWASDGRLVDQLGLCGSIDASAWTRDLAVDGSDTYTVDPACVEHRPDDQFPDWNYCTEGSWGSGRASNVVAVAADGGLVAVLDTGAGGVVVLDRTGKRQSAWLIGGKGPSSPPVDIALAGDTVYLAEQGQHRLLVRGIDGADRGTLNLRDAPASVAVGPSGDLFILGRGGWAFRYSPGGMLRAMWPMPDLTVQARDITVDRRDRVFVNYVGFDGDGFGGPMGISDAGLWVFEPEPATGPPPPQAPDACLAQPDKRAAPDRLPLGHQVDVTLSVTGSCPPVVEPVQLALVVDVSRSMNGRNAFRAALQAALDLLGQLDPRTTEVSVVTFGDSAALAEPLTRDLSDAAQHVAGLQTNGNTLMTLGVDLAHGELSGPRRNPAARQVMVILTDGAPKDPADLTGSLINAAADGIVLSALIFDSGQRTISQELLDQVLQSGGDVRYDPARGEVRDLADQLVRVKALDGLFDHIRVTDEIPANMRFVPGSAQPPATLSGQVLTWDVARVATSGLTLRYKLEPLEVGTWPTNVHADGDYQDAAGQSGHLVFPVPRVTVYSSVHPIYLPYLAKEQCVKRVQPVDVMLVLDTSESMAAPATDGGTKLDAARRAAQGFVRLLALPADHAGVVSFNSTATIDVGLTADGAVLDAALARLATSPGTRIDHGLVAANSAIAAGRRPDARTVVVLLTDGRQTDHPETVLPAAAALKAAGASVFTIGLGADVDGALLSTVASAPDAYFPSPTESDLESIYGRISERLACGG